MSDNRILPKHTAIKTETITQPIGGKSIYITIDAETMAKLASVVRKVEDDLLYWMMQPVPGEVDYVAYQAELDKRGVVDEPKQIEERSDE